MSPANTQHSDQVLCFFNFEIKLYQAHDVFRFTALVSPKKMDMMPTATHIIPWPLLVLESQALPWVVVCRRSLDSINFASLTGSPALVEPGGLIDILELH